MPLTVQGEEKYMESVWLRQQSDLAEPIILTALGKDAVDTFGENG